MKFLFLFILFPMMLCHRDKIIRYNLIRDESVPIPQKLTWLQQLSEPLNDEPFDVDYESVQPPTDEHSEYNTSSLSSTIKMKSYLDIQYYIRLYIGTQRQYFDLLFDTGSSWLWVPYKNMTSAQFLNKYDCSKSENCTMLEKDKFLFYGKGKIHGERVTDTVCLSKKICAHDHDLVLATQQNQLNYLQGDGILGMGLDNLASDKDKIKSLVQDLYDQGAISKRVFSLYLKGSFYETTYNAELIFGGVDDRFVEDESDITWTSVVDNSYWAINLNRVIIGKTSWYKEFKALIDSGTSCIFVPPVIFSEYIEAIQSYSQVRLVNIGGIRHAYCPSLDIFPTLQFEIGRKIFNVPPSYYVMKDGNNCMLLIDTSPWFNWWILGDAFMHKMYTVFDVENKRIGFMGLEDEGGSFFDDANTALATILFFCMLLGANLIFFYYCRRGVNEPGIVRFFDATDQEMQNHYNSGQYAHNNENLPSAQPENE